VEQAPPSVEAKSLSAPALGLGSSKDQDIAIISMAGRFPQAPDLAQYWENLLNGVDAIGYFPLERLGEGVCTSKNDAQAIPGGFLADIDQFDPLFFKIAPKEAAYIDPQQRFFLEVVWELLERAGYDQRKLQRTKTGVFVGASQVEYRSIWKDAATLSPYMGLGNSLCVIANRVSYLFNLRGPSIAVDTACSSSLVSVHMACQSLAKGESDLAIAGGVQIYFSPGTFEIFALAGMLAKDGRCKTFDRWADGYVRGEGAGAVLLKPLSRAKEDGDYIYAVVKGSAVNHDGSNKVGISAPNPRAQKEVIAEALRQAGLSPESIGYIEAHGTGTQLGDPVEMQALTEVFREHTDKRSFCAIGSAKSCIGHLEAAAGIAGLIKVVLSLKNAKILPTINFRQPNPHIPFQDSPFYINDKVREWDSAGGPNRAGISSLGFGGTNCHIILEEFKRDKPDYIPESEARREELLTFSAKTPSALSQMIDNLISFIDANPQHSLHDICFSANTGRECFDYRVALTVDTLEQLRDRLEILRLKGAEKAAHPYGIFYGDQAVQSMRVAFVLNGAGGLQPTALQILAKQDAFPGFQACREILRSVSGEDFGQRGENELLSSGSVWHDLFLFSFTYALAQKWISLALTPLLCIADGLGKRVAQVLAGAVELQDAITSLLGGAAAMAGPARQNIKIVDSNHVASLERIMRENKIGLCVDINGSYPPSSDLKAHQTAQDFIFVPALAYGRDLWAALVRETGKLYARGSTLCLEGLYQGFENRRLVLPTYPFQRKRYWAVRTELGSQSESAKGVPHHSTAVHSAKPTEPSRQTEFQRRKTSPSRFLQVLRCLFAQTLAMDVEEINDRVHIADYGIDSLMIQSVIVKLEDIVGAFLEPSIFFEYPTIQSLAAFLDARYPETDELQGVDSVPAPADEPESYQPGDPSDGRQKASLYTPPPKLEQLRQERLTILQDVAVGRLSGPDGFQKLKELEALHGSA
jgi:acyl transferase domain-containing protein